MKNSLEELKSLDKNKIFYCTDKRNDTQKLRVMKESEDSYFVFAPRKKNRGWRYNLLGFTKYFDFEIKEEKNDKTAKWHNRLKRAIKCMEASGLWEDIKTKFENLLTISYEEKQKIYNEYWQVDKWKDGGVDYKNFIARLKDKYAFMVYADDKGEEHIDTNYIWELSECNLKSMYFGKWQNKSEKEIIKEKLANKEKYSTWARTNYDTSFNYEPDRKMAWYSEEYKNCGNGHYYLALDNNTALFCEND